MAATAQVQPLSTEAPTFAGSPPTRREFDVVRDGLAAPSSPAALTNKRPSRLSTRRLAKRLEDLVLLKRVVRAGSINKAASEFSLSQSALSRRIERLEESLGFLILERSQNGVRYVSGVEGLDTHLERIEHCIEAMAGWIELQGQAAHAAPQARSAFPR